MKNQPQTHVDQAGLSWWGRIGFRSKPAEAVLWLLAVTGVPLWTGWALDWSAGRVLLPVHIGVSLLLFPVFVIPFWLSHRTHLAGSDRAFLRISGRIIEIGLILLGGSGLWLVLCGNPGARAGLIAHWVHLLVAVPLVALVLAHAWRYGLVRWAVGGLVLSLVALGVGAVPANGAESSGSLILGKDGKVLYSANFQAGSVSRIDRDSGKLLGEADLGGDLERVALSPQGVLAVTDALGGWVYLLDADTLKTKEKIKVDGRPMGVVHDARNRVFWVVTFEGGKLLALDQSSGKIRFDANVQETPRGLALLSDGRLLITHSLVGAVSLWDARTVPAKLVRTIALAHQEDPVETVSQGQPRLLDQIAVSPDEGEAWLPHVLWNFDHPFQFQSTVFPAVSVLALEEGKEREAVEHRKQLFQQINILEDGNRTRIVSNPTEAAFSPDGSRVYVTAAGSEDLLVFDRSRGSGLDHGERRSRRANKIEQGGAKVVQIYRHLPGDNPRGVVAADDLIYVQNAMSLDISRLDAGESGPFAKVDVRDEKFATLTAHDQLSPQIRRGLRLFHSGNTDDFPGQPMAGDFWMSCQSCHVDGFNFTNGYLLRDTPIDKFKNAIPGHQNLKTMVAGDFVGDYLRMIRETQGGMGGDTRFGTPNTDPDHPSDQIKSMMEDLHAYVTRAENLPFLPTWLRLDDPRPKAHPADWLNSAQCATCHSDIFKQWAESTHRLMGPSHPYYRVVEDLAAKTEGEGFRLWCMGCHEAQTVMSGGTKTVGEMNLFEKGGKSLIDAHQQGKPVLEEGTGCFLCHRITKIEDAGLHGGGNASFTVNLKDRETYLFETEKDGVKGWLGRTQINAKPEAHAKSYSQPFYKDPKLCGTCHGEFAPGTGSLIVNTYGEWEASPFNRPDDPAKNRTCADCHMHADVARIGQDVPGISTDGGKVKANVVTHQFTGANHHLVGLRNPDLERMSLDLLRSAAQISLPAPVDPAKLVVRVGNVGAGHALPTGVADFREIWLDITVTDTTGKVVLRDGQLAADGAVPESSRLFRKVFGDRDGKPVGLRFWRHEKMLADTRIPAGGHRDEAFDLPADAVWPLRVDVRLMFRTYPQWVTDAVRAQYPQMPPPQPVEMAHLTQTVEHP